MHIAVWHSELMQADKRGKGVSLDSPDPSSSNCYDTYD